MAYQPARVRLAAGRRWRLTNLRRIEPNAVYHLVVGGAGALVGVAIDAISPIHWWVVMGVALIGAWLFTWLTALDDVRHPWRSLRILAATVRDPGAAVRVRALAYEMPLYAPASELAGTRQLSGGGVTYGRDVLSPARPSATVMWTNEHASIRTRTVTRPADAPRHGRLPPGISHQLAMLEHDPGLDGLIRDALEVELRPVTFDVEGQPLAGTLLDLSRQGVGWIAEARVNDQFVVELAVHGVEPDGLPLVMLAADDLPEPPHS